MLCLCCLQLTDLSTDDESEDGPPSTLSELYTPHVDDAQVTDVFYEDTVPVSGTETTTSSVPLTAAAGQIYTQV